jgi:hypothetical protein
MRETAMVSEAEGAAVKGSKNIEIGRFSGKRKRQRGERCLSVESGTPHARAEKEVSDRFQSIGEFLLAGCNYLNAAMRTPLN